MANTEPIPSLTVRADGLTREQCHRIAEGLHAQGVVRVVFDRIDLQEASKVKIEYQTDRNRIAVQILPEDDTA